MDLDMARNSKEGAESRRTTCDSLSETDLMKAVLNHENLQRAWKRVKANGGVPGSDGITILGFRDFAKTHWKRTAEELKEGRYKPQPVKRAEIPKKSGGKRNLGIPSVVDRVIQHAIAQVLDPIFDPLFSENSYGFRIGRRAHDAVRKARQYWKEGYRIAVDLDLYKFFDEVNHDILMHYLGKVVRDKILLRLIGSFLRAGVVINGKIEPTTKGVPQGGPLSPLLSNIVLNEMDKELERRGHRFARYADDAIIFVRSLSAGNRVMQGIKGFLEKKLKLKVNEEKSKVAPLNECRFLGFVFNGGKIRWSEESFREFKQTLKILTNRSHGISMKNRMIKIGEYIRGWMGYFALSEYYRIIPEIDCWIRRRIRMCYWIDWKRCRNRIREMIRRHAPKYQAILTGLSRKDPWHLAKTYAMQMAIPDDFLKAEGLVSVKELWVRFHYPTGG